jgi:hypothetical protein
LKTKKWACPYCAQTSSRNWNLKIHIARHHGQGDPIIVENNESTYRTLSQHNHRRYARRLPFDSKKSTGKDDFGGSDILDSALPTLRKLVEYDDLIKKLSPKQSLTMYNLHLWLPLLSLLKYNAFQGRDNPESVELPAGFRVRVCNSCLSGNRLEPVLAPHIDLEALTKINHTCKISEAQEKEYNVNNIREAQRVLLLALRQVVSIRIIQQREAARTPLRLKGLEFGGPMAVLQFMENKNKRPPENRSWIEKDDCFKISNSGNSSIEKQDQWVHRLIKAEGNPKIINIHDNELFEFLDVCKATFGVFRVQIDGKKDRYLVISIVL